MFAPPLIFQTRGSLADPSFVLRPNVRVPAALTETSIRLVPDADGRLTLAEAGEFPDAGARGIDVGGDVDVDQIRPIRFNAPAYRLGEVRGAIDADAFDARGARHGGKVGIVTVAGLRMVEVGGQLAASEIAPL